MLFNGVDSSGNQNLWVTDGTAAGTTELLPQNAGVSGLLPTDLTAFGNDMLFQGQDASGSSGLWITDGTTAGTAEIAIDGGSASGVTPAYITAFNGNALFQGIDANGQSSLWITDGTSAGTQELADSSVNGGIELSPSDFVTLGRNAYFEANNSDGNPSLWVTDGTTLGTTELQVAGAWIGGLDPTNILAYDGELLFNGVDAAGNNGLWVSDGTAAGTVELAVSGAASNDGLNPDNFEILNGKVLFSGYDSNGYDGLWTTDGTAAGTTELAVGGADPFGLDPGYFGLGPTPSPTDVVSALAATPDASGPLAVGHVITFAVTPSAPVTVIGSGFALALSNGEQAAYTGQDASGNLLFSYTVQQGDDTPDLLVTGVVLGTASVEDQNSQRLDTSALASLATDDTGIAIDTVPPGMPAFVGLAPASDSGVLGDNITNITTPVVTGTAEANSTVTLYEGVGAGALLLGTTVADGSGNWSITSSILGDGTHDLTASATDAAGNVSAISGQLAITVDDIAPVVIAQAFTFDNGNSGLVGSGDPNATVSITENNALVGTAQADGTGVWSFDAGSLSAGAHTVTASETDLAGNVGITSPIGVNVADPRFDIGDAGSSLAGAVGSDYSGPVAYLQSQFIYFGSADVILGARVDNVFLHGGSGTDALAAFGGNNVLDGGGGSNWLVGATGEDGGHDTFFVDGRGNNQFTWDTILNFHAGDMLTLWGFDPNAGQIGWTDNQGAPGHTGATLHAAFNNGTGSSAYITFGGLSTSSAHFNVANGSIGGSDYLMVTRTS